MYPELSTYIESVIATMAGLPQQRKDLLKKIALFVQSKKYSSDPASLIFICTHNSRRSHLSQIWAATAAHYFGIEEGISTYSGGTVATAFNPRAVAAIKRAGFKVESPDGDNPRYLVSYAADGPIMECFSKKYDHPGNAKENFLAVLTCSEADRNCPFISGADLRVPLPYADPKEADGTKQEAVTYDQRCRQIATEMFQIMSEVVI
jgi:arsenate reductase